MTGHVMNDHDMGAGHAGNGHMEGDSGIGH